MVQKTHEESEIILYISFYLLYLKAIAYTVLLNIFLEFREYTSAKYVCRLLRYRTQHKISEYAGENYFSPIIN